MKVAIVGGGIVGRILGVELRNQGWGVDLFEKSDQQDSCSYAAAGMLAPLAELHSAESKIYRLGIESIKRWPFILKRLTKPVYFQQKGTLITAHSNDFAELDFLINKIQHKIADVNIQPLSAMNLKNFEPDLPIKHNSYFFPQEAQINTQQVMDALKSTLIELGVTWHYKFVEVIQPHKIVVGQREFTFEWVFDCRGLGASHEIKALRAVRGELIWVHAPLVNITRPLRIYHPRYPIYVVPRANHQYIIGATEIESANDASISVKSMLELLSAVYCVHPGFAEAAILKTVVQHRPTMPNHLPYLQHQSGLTRINGLYRHGYLITPAIVAEVLNYFELQTI